MVKKLSGKITINAVHERDAEKVYANGYRNGYEPRKIKTPEGKIGLQIPQVRGGEEPYRSKLKTFFKNNTDVFQV